MDNAKAIQQLMIQIQTLTDKVNYITTLLEDVAMENSPCNQKKRQNKDMETILNMVKNSPLKKHPMFAEMLKPLEDIIGKQMG